MLQSGFHNARSGNTDIDDHITLGDAMESTGHKGIIIGGIAEDDKLGAAERISVGRALGCFFNRASHEAHCIHVDASPGRSDIDRAADTVCHGQSLRYGFDQESVRLRHGFRYEG